MRHHDNETIVSVKHYGEQYVIELPGDITADKFVETCAGIMSLMGYSSSCIIEALHDTSDEMREMLSSDEHRVRDWEESA